MAYTQEPGRSPFPQTGRGIPAPFLQVDSKTGSKTKILPADMSSSKTGRVTTAKTSYGKKAIDAVKNATNIEFTKEGMETLAPSSSSKNTDLNLGKYKDYLKTGSATSSGKTGETVSTYVTRKERVENPAKRAQIESYVRDLNPGKTVKISDYK